MPENCYFHAKGKKSGDMDGSVMEKGFEKTTYCYVVEFGIVSPTDQATGNAGGKRVNKPIRLVTKLEESAIHWLQSVVTNEEIAEAFIYFPVKDVVDGKKPYMTFKVTSGRFVSCRILCPDTLDPANAQRGHLCEVELIARQWEIKTTKYKESGGVEHAGGVSTSDSWA